MLLPGEIFTELQNREEKEREYPGKRFVKAHVALYEKLLLSPIIEKK